VATETPKHYLLSPSAAHRWLPCSGEPTLRSSVPNLGSAAALDGTTAHWAGEQCLRQRRDPRDFAGHRCPETELYVTSEMCQAVRVYVNHCESIRGEWVGIEFEFTLPELSPVLGGTSDFATVNGRCLRVVDYKNGSGYSVQAEGNPQTRIYALGAYETVKKDNPELAAGIGSVLIDIVQPNVEGEEPIRTEKLLLTELLEWRDTVLKRAIRRTESDKETLVAGAHCRFCPAKAVCPAQYKANLAVAQVDFAKPIAVAAPKPELLTIDQLSRVLQAKDQIESWLASVEAHAQSVLASGKPVPGFKLVKKRSNRAWRDEAAAEKWLKGLLGPEGAYKPRELLTAPAAEKALELFGVELNSALVVKPDNGETITDVGDRRPAFSPKTAAAVFLQDEDFLS
jgi:hypothetical protein